MIRGNLLIDNQNLIETANESVATIGKSSDETVIKVFCIIYCRSGGWIDGKVSPKIHNARIRNHIYIDNGRIML